MKGLVHRDCGLVGFVLDCLGASLTFEEAQEWVYYMIEKYDNLPPYMYELTTAKDWRNFEDMIGFPTFSGVTNDEMKAILGISYVRGIATEDGEFNISKKSALNALKRNPHIGQRFQETFPFLNFEMPT